MPDETPNVPPTPPAPVATPPPAPPQAVVTPETPKPVVAGSPLMAAKAAPPVEPEPTPDEPTKPAQKTVIWDGTWSGVKPRQKELQFGVIHAKQGKNAEGNFYLDAKHGQAAFFPNPETYPKGGYFAGEAVPLP